MTEKKHNENQLKKIPTGIKGLDQVLHGGIPEYSFNLIAGGPGTGKTTLAHQIMFASPLSDHPALYFTVLGEPPIKMLRYQKQMSFFDSKRLGKSIRFVNLSREALEHDLSKVLSSIVKEVDKSQPKIVIVDSFRTIVRTSVLPETGELNLQSFLQRLAIYLTGWQATTFLVGEYLESELLDNPLFTIADGIFWLFQSIDRNAIVRKLQVIKLRGQASISGLHTFRITEDGIQIFPRIAIQYPTSPHVSKEARCKVSTGITGLNEMMGGGPLEGDVTLLAGPTGSGKSIVVAQFIHEGARRGESAVLAVFEERPRQYLERAKTLGINLAEMVSKNLLKIIYLRPLDLSVEETLNEIWDEVHRLNAKRVVIDSLSGFELALAPTFRDDFRESTYRLVGAVSRENVTMMMTVEITETYTSLSFSPHTISFLSDNVILQRYFEESGELKRAMIVVKMRNSQHSSDFRAYDITNHGVVIGKALKGYHGIISGMPELKWEKWFNYLGLVHQEAEVLGTLMEMGESDLATITQKTGLATTLVEEILNRLVSLNYAIRIEVESKVLYRPLAQLLGGEIFLQTKKAA